MSSHVKEGKRSQRDIGCSCASRMGLWKESGNGNSVFRQRRNKGNERAHGKRWMREVRLKPGRGVKLRCLHLWKAM